MSLDFKNINQCKIFFDGHLFYPMYKQLGDVGRSYPSTYLITPLVVVTDSFFNLTEAVCGVSEAFFKGLANIAGSYFSDRFNCYRGRLQLVGGLATGGLAPIVIISRSFKILQQFPQNPYLFSSDQARKYALSF